MSRQGTETPTIFYQLGAPALIHQRNSDDDLICDIPPRNYPLIHGPTIETILQRSNRVKHRWAGLDRQLESTRFKPPKKKQIRIHKRTSRGGTPTKHNNRYLASTDNDLTRLERIRLNLLLDSGVPIRTSRILQRNYAQHEKLYVDSGIRWFRGYTQRPRIKEATYHGTRKSALQNQLSHPSYLAPFGKDALTECEDVVHKRTFMKKRARMKAEKHDLNPPRKPQGNCLLTFSCACPCCRSQQLPHKGRLWLVHPTGPLLDTIVVSALRFPYEYETDGDSDSNNSTSPSGYGKAQSRNFVGLCLDDTILEIKQGGSWLQHGSATFIARTGTHISILKVSAVTPDEGYHQTAGKCWGKYAIEELERLDQRSLSRYYQSYEPVSLAVHPKYGNQLVGSKLAFASHAENEQNVVHDCMLGSRARVTKHTISNLQAITHIDFSTTHPMCLWSAARSYVTPAPANNMHQKIPNFGRGTSLYTIDLRSDSAIFQWSPSAEEMVTEGTHSISSIATDWSKDNRLFVSSTSALKSWEIDTRMPVRPVNVWSLTGGCEDSATTMDQTGLHGEGSLFSFVTQSDYSRDKASPIIHVNTDPGTFGFHFYQRPRIQPRFQADSLQVIATPGLNRFEQASIATSSMFPLAEHSEDVYTCGISSVRVPFSHFATKEDMRGLDCTEDDPDVLCTITMTNRADIFCHSLLESSKNVRQCQPVPNLPLGMKIINIPESVDLKMWDNDGAGEEGNNLSLFLSNQYPTPRDALIVQEENQVHKQVTIKLKQYNKKKWTSNDKDVTTTPSNKRFKQEDGTSNDNDGTTVPLNSLPVWEEERANDFKGGTVPFYTRPTGDIGIVAEASNLTRGDAPLMMPASLVERATRRIDFRTRKDLDKEDDLVVLGDTRSDLSPLMLQKASQAWDKMAKESKIKKSMD